MKQSAKAVAQTGMLREPQVLELIPVSAATLWRLVKEGKFPKPRRISERAVAWRCVEIQEWIDSREEVGHDAE